MDGGFVARADGGRALVETMRFTGAPLADVMAAARDRLCADALALGFTLVASDCWEDLAALNERHRADWFPLLPKPAGAPAFWIGAVDREGEVAGTHGAILVDCSAESFGARLESLSLFHGEPRAGADADAGADAGEWCFAGSEVAHATTGAVCWIVAGWNRPDCRGLGLFHLLARVARLVALHRWRPSWVVGLVSPEAVSVWSGRSAGRRTLEPRPTILYRQPDVGRLPLRLLRMSRAALVADLQQHGAASPSVQRDGG